MSISLTETNLLGRGLVLNASTSFAKQERNVIFSLTNPWLFDKPIHATTDLYIKRSLYDEFKFIEQEDINESITGGTVGLGVLSARFFDSTISGRIGTDGITYKQTPKVKMSIPEQERLQLQTIFDWRFTSGAYIWTGISAFKDVRNHPVHPSRGYQWAATMKFALHSVLKDNPKDNTAQTAALAIDRVRFGYAKCDIEGSWYTPLIGERDLVLCLHGHADMMAVIKIVAFHSVNCTTLVVLPAYVDSCLEKLGQCSLYQL